MGIHHCILSAEKDILILYATYCLVVQTPLSRIKMVKVLWMNVKMKTKSILRTYLQSIILNKVRICLMLQYMQLQKSCGDLLFLVLENVSEWSIENFEEEQVFEKMGYGIKLVIPQYSVEKGKDVKAEVKVVAPAKAAIELPPNVEPVSCFYEIKTTQEFNQPIKLCIQHNVELTSPEDCKQLAFIRAKGPPPYKFEVVPFDTIIQEFKVNDNSGVVQISDFSILVVVWQKLIDPLAKVVKQPPCSYIIAVFVKLMEKSCWEIQAVVTKDLQPYLEVDSHSTNII